MLLLWRSLYTIGPVLYQSPSDDHFLQISLLLLLALRLHLWLLHFGLIRHLWSQFIKNKIIYFILNISQKTSVLIVFFIHPVCKRHKMYPYTNIICLGLWLPPTSARPAIYFPAVHAFNGNVFNQSNAPICKEYSLPLLNIHYHSGWRVPIVWCTVSVAISLIWSRVRRREQAVYCVTAREFTYKTSLHNSTSFLCIL